MKRTVVSVAVLFLLGSVAYAADSPVIGAGSYSCEKYSGFKSNEDIYGQFLQWIAGYVSGFNFYSGGKQINLTDQQATGVFIDQYCKNNPSHTVALATNALIQNHGGPKARHQWKQ